MKRNIIFTLFIFVSLFAKSQLVDGIYYEFDETTNEAKVTKNFVANYSGNIVIPQVVKYDNKEYVVTTIYPGAFRFCIDLKSVEIGEKVISIGSNCFEGCSNLDSIKIGPNVEKIGSFAFMDCTNLKSLILPDKVNQIGSEIFKGCASLENLVIGDGVTFLNPQFFNGCSSIETITFGKAIKEMQCLFPSSFSDVYINDLRAWCDIVLMGYPLYGTSNIYVEGKRIKDLIIPEGVEVVKRYTFMGYLGLESIVIPETVNRIETNSFFSCKDLKSVSISNSVITIEDGAFSGCPNITSLKIGAGVKYIETSAFYGCHNLEVINIPNSVISIGQNAFFECKKVKTIIIGNGVNFIEQEAFHPYADELKDVYCYAEHVPVAGYVAFGWTDEVTLHVPEASINEYKNAAVWKDFKKIVAIKKDDPIPTGMNGIPYNKNEKMYYYSIDGKRFSQPQNGLNILRNEDGKVVKKIIKK